MRRPSFSRYSTCIGSLCAFSLAFAQTPDNPATVTVSFAEFEQIFPEGASSTVVTVEMTLSNRFFADVTIPFSINPASTAIYQQSIETGAREDGDYFVAEDTSENDLNGYLFDPETLTGSMTFSFGEISRTFSVTINNDTLKDGEATEQALETIIFDIDQSAFEGSALGDKLTHTLIIQDDDTPTGEFPEHILFERNRRYEADEDGFFSINLRLRTAIPEDTELIYSLSFAGNNAASPEDFVADTVGNEVNYDPNDSSNTVYTGVGRTTISAGSTFTTISLTPAFDLDDEGEENFFVQLDRLSINNPDSPNDGRTFTVDSQPIEAFIVESESSSIDPTLAINVSIFDANEKAGASLRRTESITLLISLTATFPEDIFIPLSFSGSAGAAVIDEDGNLISGEYTNDVFMPEDEDDVNDLPDFFAFIPSGATLATLTITSQADGDVAKDLTVSIGDSTDALPFYVENAGQDSQSKVYLDLTTGTDLQSSYQIDFPEIPLEIGFGRFTSTLNSAIETDEVLMRASRSVVSESIGAIIQVPIYLTNFTDESLSYTVEVFTNQGDAPATLFDFTKTTAAQEGWDAQVIIGNQALNSVGTSVDVTAGFFTSDGTFDFDGNTLTVILNNDEEDPIPYDEFANYVEGNYSGIEGSENNFEPYEETIRIRITKTDENSPNIDQAFAEYEIVIRELPDIELTDAYPANQLTPSAATYNSLTGWHEAMIDFTPPASLASALNQLNQPVQNSESAEDTYLAGYRAYKTAYRSFQWDEADPDNSDALATKLQSTGVPNGFIDIAFEPNRVSPFYYEAQRPFALRFPSSMTPIVLLEGVDRPIDQLRFELGNADTIGFQDELFVPLALPDVDPDTSVGDAQSGSAFRSLIPTSDEMAFNLEFASSGSGTLDLSRLNQAGAVRVFLSTDTLNFFGDRNSPIFSGLIHSVQELPDRRIYLDIGLASTTFVDPNNLAIEYLTEDGEWIPAQPGQIRKLGSQFIWIDQGPPATWPHPRDVSMRLYRLSHLIN